MRARATLSTLTLAMTTVMLVACSTPTVPPAAPTGPVDPYYPTSGNSGYDAQRYELKITYDPGSGVLTGESIMRAVSTETLRSFALDLHGLTLDSVTVDTVETTTTRDESKLTITPGTPITSGQGFTVVSRYHGVPTPYGDHDDADGFLRVEDGATAIGEPLSASTWFPVNDHPRDKATYAFAITVPNGGVAVANGAPQGSESLGGRTTWRYEENSPMASYLATMIVGDFDLKITTHKDIPLVLAVHRRNDERSTLMGQLERTGPIIDVLSGMFGPYPFTSAGGVVPSPELHHDALENQTRPIYSEGPPSESLMVHELAHQWFGNSVSVTSWQDMWLNEGFATYAEWLYTERTGGQSADETFRQTLDRAKETFWTVTPGNPGKNNLFHKAVYTRGAMTLHALRRTVGDDTFFKILQEWATRYKNGNATTDQLRELSTTLSGKQLDDLFRGWLHQPGKPPAAVMP